MIIPRNYHLIISGSPAKVLLVHYSRIRQGSNPGINHYLKITKDDNQQQNFNKNTADNFDADELESDFMNAHKTHKQYEQEIETQKVKIQQHIIARKYFKNQQPNFLTYAEKEQIKYLHNRDPNEWTIEKLSESFPADFSTIKKIVRAKWIANSEKRIRAHDKLVIENWKMLKSGKFPKLHPELLDHIQRFANRQPEDLKNLKIDWETRPALPKPKSTEFLNIITSCKGANQNTKLLSKDSKNLNDNQEVEIYKDSNKKMSDQAAENETFLTGKVSNKKQMRYQDFLKVNNIVQESESIDKSNFQIKTNENQLEIEQEEDLVEESNIDNKDLTTNLKEFGEVIAANEENEVVVSREDMKKYNMNTIKERIYIPRKLLKKGATYKVEDCYYDYDGEFLFRVPGMTNK